MPEEEEEYVGRVEVEVLKLEEAAAEKEEEEVSPDYKLRLELAQVQVERMLLALPQAVQAVVMERNLASAG